MINPLACATLEPIPVDGEEGRPNVWAPQHIDSLRAYVQRQSDTFAKIGDGKERIAVWHAPAGKPIGEAYSVAPESQFLQNPFTEGRYYVRISLQHEQIANGGSVLFLTAECEPARVANEKADYARAVHTMQERTIATETAYGETQARRLKEANEEADRQRTRANQLELERDRLKERVASLEAQIEAMREDEKPWIDDDSSAQLLQVATLAANGGLEKPAQHLAVMVASVAEFFIGIYPDKVLMGRLMGKSLPVYRQFAARYNEIARQSIAKGPTGKPWALLLPSTAATQIEAGDTKKTAKAKGKGKR